MKPWVMEVFRTGLFTPISLERGEFVLRDTDYMIVVRKDATVWKKKKVRARRAPTRQLGDTSEAIWAAQNKPSYIHCSFEEVFDSAPDHIREKMIYHLDILSRGGMSFETNTKIRGMTKMLVAFDDLITWSKK